MTPFVVVVALMSISANTDAARAAEEKAFAAIEAESWCEAAGQFQAADALAPSADLLFNAAQAAEYGGDRQLAANLYVRLLGKELARKRKADVDKRLRKITRAIRKKGPGTPCAPPVEDPAPMAIVKEAEVDAEVVDAEVIDAEVQVDPIEEVEETPAVGAGPNVAAIATMGSGAAVLLVGGVAAVLGALPYFQHSAAREQILNEQASSGDARNLQDDQRRARDAWESYGEVTVISGVGAIVVGAAVLATGVILASAGGAE